MSNINKRSVLLHFTKEELDLLTQIAHEKKITRKKMLENDIQSNISSYNYRKRREQEDLERRRRHRHM